METKTKTSPRMTAAPRLDLEPLYTELKNAIGKNWADYKEATTLFLIGQLNQHEFSSRVDRFLNADPKTLQAHNNFICAIINNLSCDLPENAVASFVSAIDKPSSTGANVGGAKTGDDAAELRLKTEVMQLQPKDRRRLKAIPEPDPDADVDLFEEYQREKQVRIPEQLPPGAGGLNKTNWELEIQKRYTQPLASEVGEFPDADSIYARMVPICYEESIPNGASRNCAPFLALATEMFVKDILSNVFTRTRVNGPSDMMNGCMTAKYRRQLEREESAYIYAKNSSAAAATPANTGPDSGGSSGSDSALYPVETREAAARLSLGVNDVKFALDLGGGMLGNMPLLTAQVSNSYENEEFDAEREDYSSYQMEAKMQVSEIRRTGFSNNADGGRESMEIDGGSAAGEEPNGWEGGTESDQQQLTSLLDDCLSMAA